MTAAKIDEEPMIEILTKGRISWHFSTDTLYITSCIRYIVRILRHPTCSIIIIYEYK